MAANNIPGENHQVGSFLVEYPRHQGDGADILLLSVAEMGIGELSDGETSVSSKSQRVVHSASIRPNVLCCTVAQGSDHGPDDRGLTIGFH